MDSQEVTPRDVYLNRRQFLTGAAATTLGVLATVSLTEQQGEADEKLSAEKRTDYAPGEKQTTYKDAASYNNFYEFSTGKEDVVALAKNFKTRPWTITVEGLVKRPRTFDIDSLIRRSPLEERIYRFRCVEAWAMVLPWVGFPLVDFIKTCEPLSKAAFVEFVTLHDTIQMPGQLRDVIPWPYVEGLRMDEAMHPLTLLAIGMYGKILPNQNGAPIRLVVPWKYGFKSIKSVVKIRFTDHMPTTAWVMANPGEYGFYANVNPEVDHPRWSQATERRLGEFLRRKTLPFNGYAKEVASLYQGMDLRKNF